MSIRLRYMLVSLVGVLVIAALSGCSQSSGSQQPAPGGMSLPELGPVELADGERLRVAATTSILGDVVRQIGGDLIELTVLMQPGQDPHSYEPAAADLARLQDTHVIFANGLNFEEGLLATLESVDTAAPIVPVSAGVEVIQAEGEPDPHVWQDPRNVMIWAENIALVLSTLDPVHADSYRGDTVAYTAQLDGLHERIQERVEEIPPASRKLVTNHDTFAYFARAYGFEVVGTVLLGASDLAEPSAGQIAQLVQAVEDTGVPAIFVETTINDDLAQVIADEVGRDIQVLTLYTDALGRPGSGAETYIDMMLANAETLVRGLGGQASDGS